NIYETAFCSLAVGTVKFVKFQGNIFIKMLPEATAAAKGASLKLVQNASVGKVTATAGAAASASAAVGASLASIVTSLGLSIAQTKVTGFRMDQIEKGMLLDDQVYTNMLRLIEKNHGNLDKANQDIQKQNIKLGEFAETNQELAKALDESELNVQILNDEVAKANQNIADLEAANQEIINKVEEFEGEVTEEIDNLKTSNETLTTNLNTAKTNIANLTKVIEQLGIDVANLKARNTELTIELDKLKFQHSITVAEIIGLKKEMELNQTLNNSKLNLISAKLVLAEKNMSTGNVTFDAFPQAAQENIAATQTATLKIANQLSPNPLPSSQVEINTGQLVDNNPFQNILENLLPNISPSTAEVTDVQLEDLEVAILAGITANFNNLGLADMPNQLTNIQNQTTPTAIRSSVETGICNSTNAGGCLHNNVRQPLENLLNNLLGNTDGINAGIGGVNAALNQTILGRINDVHGVVTNNFNILNHAQYGLSAMKTFLTTAWETTRAGKVLELLSVVISLHNAAMLSRNLGVSIGDLVSNIANNAISFITNEDQSPIDINDAIGNTVEGLLINLLGADNYQDIGDTFTKTNRIINSASNIIWTIQGIQMGLAYGLETVGNYTGRIGNALKKSGAVLESSYNWMNEQMNFRSGRLGQLNNVINEVQSAESVISEVHQVTSEFREIQQQTNYLGDQVGNLTNEITTKEEETTTTNDEYKTNSLGEQPTQSDLTPDPIQ
ncbi:MAG: hypothetical protein AB4372_06965, partial [Xenococcus sp. (in: cyanobacteria)]